MESYIDNSVLFFLDRYIILLSVYLCTAIIFLNTELDFCISKRKTLYIIILIIVFPYIFQLLGGNSNLILKSLYIISICISLLPLKINSKFSTIPSAIISVSVSLCVQYISAIISGSVFYLFHLTQYTLLVTLTGCVIQVLLCLALSRMKLLKNGIKYISADNHTGLGLLVSSYILIFSLLLTQHDEIDLGIAAILVMGIPLVLTGLILWIRSIVQRYNKNKLKNREDEYTQQEITEKNARIERLEGEVATLAKQLHRDNHLLSSVECSVQTIAETDSADKRKQLANEFHALYSERNDMIAKEQQESKILPSTGIALIDGSLSEMYVKATAHGIAFDLIVGEELYYLVNNIISQTELQTLLCDHIKDAVIAVTATGNTNGRILVTIEKNDGLFEISIRDNGIEFAPDTLAKLGRERITTHADEGGSGIGFMTTFETLAKTKSSLIITEYETETPFTKAVSFVFDGLHRFVIDSYRKDDLKEIVTRDDVILL